MYCARKFPRPAQNNTGTQRRQWRLGSQGQQNLAVTDSFWRRPLPSPIGVWPMGVEQLAESGIGVGTRSAAPKHERHIDLLALFAIDAQDGCACR